MPFVAIVLSFLYKLEFSFKKNCDSALISVAGTPPPAYNTFSSPPPTPVLFLLLPPSFLPKLFSLQVPVWRSTTVRDTSSEIKQRSGYLSSHFHPWGLGDVKPACLEWRAKTVSKFVPSILQPFTYFSRSSKGITRSFNWHIGCSYLAQVVPTVWVLKAVVVLREVCPYGWCCTGEMSINFRGPGMAITSNERGH